jgi:hypothetical protein
MEEREQEPDARDGPELPLCPGCMAENHPAADFCVECGHPLSVMATTDPFRSVFSQGYWYRTAASGRIKPIVFWTTWFLLIPTGGFLLSSVLESFFDLGYDPPVRLCILRLLLCGGLLVAYIVLLYRMTANYRAYRRGERESSE